MHIWKLIFGDEKGLNGVKTCPKIELCEHNVESFVFF
jgi:hypothetical protein